MEPADGYINHPTGHAPERHARLAAPAPGTGHRPRIRIALVALRAYEQRAERRARMRAWLAARTGGAGAAGAVRG